MTTLHLENTLRDYDSWKSVFDKFDRVRADNGVRSYRIRRRADDPLQVVVDLEFDDRGTAEAFAEILAKVRSTPQSRGELVSFVEPVLLEVVEDRVLTNAGAPPSGHR
ncbi:MAG TPA: hypothetical protein VFO49_15510 [Nocardioides sp.]|nr:hypothetical protein [Nocardioides sp.]